MKYTMILAAICTLMLVGCNKEKKKMKGLIGNWTIARSERAVIHSGGGEDMYEDITGCGEVVVSELEPKSDEAKKFSFRYYGSGNDTLVMEGTLYTDEKNKRIVFEKVLSDSTVYSNLIWTVDKSKKNKQIWSAYGVDTTYFYPTNKFNPGDANNWLMWRITLKRDDGGISGS